MKGVDAVAIAVIVVLAIAAVAWYFYASPHPSTPATGVSASEINSIGAGYGEMNLPQSIGGEGNLPNPDTISVDTNDINMDLPPSI